jgi:hypothetical protein
MSPQKSRRFFLSDLWHACHTETKIPEERTWKMPTVFSVGQPEQLSKYSD